MPTRQPVQHSPVLFPATPLSVPLSFHLSHHNKVRKSLQYSLDWKAARADVVFPSDQEAFDLDLKTDSDVYELLQHTHEECRQVVDILWSKTVALSLR